MNCTPRSSDDEDLSDEEEGVLHAEDEAIAVEAVGDEILPHCGLEDEDVETLNVPYSTRAVGDWVSAGTLDPGYAYKAAKHGWRRLRFFPSWEAAEEWARNHFGERFRGRVMDAVNSGSHWWAFLVKGPRGENVQS